MKIEAASRLKYKIKAGHIANRLNAAINGNQDAIEEAPELLTTLAEEFSKRMEVTAGDIKHILHSRMLLSQRSDSVIKELKSLKKVIDLLG